MNRVRYIEAPALRSAEVIAPWATVFHRYGNGYLCFKDVTDADDLREELAQIYEFLDRFADADVDDRGIAHGNAPMRWRDALEPLVGALVQKARA